MSRGDLDLVDTPDRVTRILSDGSFVPIDYHGRHAALGARLGLDFSTILFAIDHIPLCQHGTRHQDSRRRLAQLIASTRARFDQNLPGKVARHLAPLGMPGCHDALATVIAPLVADTLSDLVGLDLDIAPDSLISGVFSQSIGVARRRRMEAELAALKAQIVDAMDGDETDVGDRLALVILGRDALLGTLSLSLAAQIRAAQGALTHHPWPEIPPETGVPYVDRRPLDPLSEGSELRVDLRSLGSAANARERLKFFGAGGHTCLGRNAALAIWREMGRVAARFDRPIEITDWHLRKDDVFHCPDRFEVRVT